MQLLQLANFVLQNLLQSRISFIIFFHCWANNETLQFAQQIQQPHQQLIYYQFAHLRDWNWEHLEQRYLDHAQPTLAIYVDLRCMRSRSLLAEASRARLYNQHYHWVLHDSSEAFSFYDFFRRSNISIDADVDYVKQHIPNSGDKDAVVYTVYDVYSNGNHIGGQLNMTVNYELSCNRSSCDGIRYLSSLHLRSKYGNREQLTDVVLRVATVVTQRPITWPPEQLLQFLNQINDTHIDGIARFGFQLSLILKDLLQCGMNFTFKDRWSYGDYNGGSVGAVVDETADIGSAPCLATPGRLHLLSAIIETGYFRSICLFRTPHNAGIRGDVFLQPFSALVWFLFAGILLLIALMLWLAFYMESKRMHRSWRLEFVPSLLSTCLISFGAACSQSSALTPRSTGGRLAYFALFLISFIMYNYYTSVVVSSLLSSPVKSKIQTVQQLAESSLTVGLEPLSFTKSYLNYTQRPEIHLLRKRKIEPQSHNPELWLPAEQGILRVRDRPGYVFIFEASSGYEYVERYYTQQEICDLNEILFRPELRLYTHLHRNSSYKELVRLRLLRVLETGIYRKHRTWWARMRLHCYSQNFVITVGMEYVAPLFFMLLCGYLLVLLLLLLELAWQRYAQRSD
ncbi:PREDICTED: glutamate receptor ionotropic, kainate 5 [Drosophila arizonae]|uniref:Glutamate receptor ionotropic, kainate 5 n=1 Tax=Drosophila arizonae TaxID=7263 RepID=A0ABM1P233_DROAR|nr:PREDICTED: glutamate receptor ionotropic, kainate 5 [Drosophila arizonae]